METFSVLLALCEGASDTELWCYLCMICAWTNGWANSHDAGDLRCYSVHYDVTVATTLMEWNPKLQLKCRTSRCMASVPLDICITQFVYTIETSWNVYGWYIKWNVVRLVLALWWGNPPVTGGLLHQGSGTNDAGFWIRNAGYMNIYSTHFNNPQTINWPKSRFDENLMCRDASCMVPGGTRRYHNAGDHSNSIMTIIDF